MKIFEVIDSKSAIQPSVVSQQQRIAKLVKRIMASDQDQQPTEMDKVLATRRYDQIKKQCDKHYAEQLRQQLATVQSAIK